MAGSSQAQPGFHATIFQAKVISENNRQHK